jgi:hypothetical protein
MTVMTVTACGGAGEPAFRKTVFDPTASAPGVAAVDIASTAREIESPYHPLDRTGGPESARWVGVSLLGGSIRLSRPSQWTIRDADLDPGRAFVRYASPKAFSFAIYERSDSPSDLWRDILQRYEADVARSGARVVARGVPVGTHVNQARAYSIERKEPRPSRSREYLVRSEHRVVLIQLVMQDGDLARLGPELVDILNNLEVL